MVREFDKQYNSEKKASTKLLFGYFEMYSIGMSATEQAKRLWLMHQLTLRILRTTTN